MALRKTSILVMVAGVLACARGPEEQQPSARGPALKAEAAAQMRLILDQKASRSPVQRKISSQLLFARDGLPGATGKSPLLEGIARRDELGRVLVDVKGELPANLDVELAQLGGAVVTSSAAHKSARVWIDLGRLEALASLKGVAKVRPAFEATTARADAPARYGLKAPRVASRAERIATTQKALKELAFAPRPVPLAGATTNVGAVTSEGSLAHNADAARKFYAVDGTGVKVGVLSDSDDYKEASIASGDLPADTVTVPGESGRPGSGEGTAMMEIVHDVAPGAQIFFATAFNGPESFAENIRRLRFEYGCDVIVDDIIYFFESPYQDDIIAQAVNDVTRDGAVYVSSAGNQGNYSDGTSGAWEGDFAEGGTHPELPGYVVHDFGDGVISNRIEASGGPLMLHWADPGSLDDPRSSNDYDLFLLDADLRTVELAAVDWQNGDDLPWEYLGYNIPAGYRIVVARPEGVPNRAMRVMFFGGELGLSTPGATYGHNSAEDGIGAAAVDIAEAVGGKFIGGSVTPVELYSSDGYRRIFYTASGELIGPAATFLEGQPEWRWKPDMAAADGVKTTLPSFTGLNPFFGTSAAAPHIGGLAALLKQGNPVEDGWHIKQALLNSAIDIEAAGPDRDSGKGIPDAMVALKNIGAKPSVFLELGATAVSPATLLPGSAGTLAVTVVNNGGAAARSATATLTSASPYVTVTAGSASYGTIAAGGSATSATPFAFTVSPSTPCGARATLTLTVSFRGRGKNPTTFSFDVQVGPPAATPVVASFTGSVAIPDDDLAGVDIPLSVAGAGAIAKLVFSIDGTACSTAIGSTTVGLAHTWAADVTATLTSPAGTSVRLFTAVGGSGNNFCQTVLDDAATTSISTLTSANAPFTGTYKPAGSLAAFTGQSADGTWVLNVSDSAFLDTGTVQAFSVQAYPFTCAP